MSDDPRSRRLSDSVERRRRSRAIHRTEHEDAAAFPVVRFGQIYAHSITLDEAVASILTRVRSGQGGFVVTPNVDHICQADHDPEFRAAYRSAFLSLPDGQPLMWMARAFGTPLAQKVSGSDVVRPLLELAAAQGCTAFFLGATEDTCIEAARRLTEDIPDLNISGWACPFFDPDGDASQLESALEKIQAQQPDLVLVAMSTPKQEVLMLRYADSFAPAVAIGIGASLDFIAGKVPRAPQWMSQAGLEWLFRLSREPGRMWRRYLVHDRAILRIFLKTRRDLKHRQSLGE